MKTHKKAINSIIGISILLFLFVFFSYFTRQHQDTIKELIVKDSYGMAVYFFFMLFETVVSPLSFLPLIAVASNLWGWVITGFLNWSAWVLGSTIAFLLSRKYGRCFIEKIIPTNSLAEIESYVPDDSVFMNIIVLRIILPSDLLSYAIGFLTEIKFKTYFWATFIGVAPFSFLLAYIGVLPLKLQIIGFVFSVLFIGTALFITSKSKKRIKKLDKLKKDIAKGKRKSYC